jgi:hypothetical protein
MSTTEFQATIEGTVPQLVQCVHCNERYIYEMRRTGSGSAESVSEKWAQQRAEGLARKRLEAKLGPDACDPVPCRRCLRYQPYMRAVAARRKYGVWGRLAWAVIVPAGLVAVMAVAVTVGHPGERSVAIGVGLVALGALASAGALLVRVRRLMATYEPDREPEHVRRPLSARGMTVADYNERQAVRVREAYRERDEPLMTRFLKHGRLPAEGPLVIGLWVEPSLFTNGGVVPIVLSDTDEVAVSVPVGANPGETYDVAVVRGRPVPFKVRITPIRVHPAEVRLE